MAQGIFPGDSSEAEKARYRRKLAEWKAMGFDVSALEVLLETDFEKFKEKRFELMRSQIHGSGPAPSPVPSFGISAASLPPQAGAHRASEPFETHRSAAVARRPGLHSHFVQPPRPSDGPAAPRDEPARHERLHSEMRYPSARRRRPDSEVKTFSVAVVHDQRPRGISVGEERRQPQAGRAASPKKVVKAGPRAIRPVPGKGRKALRDEERPEVAVEEDEAPGPDEEPEMAVEEEGEPEELPRQAGEEEEHIAVEEEGEPAGDEPGAEEDASEEGEAPDEEAAGEEAAQAEGEAAGGQVAESEEETRDEEPPPSLGYFTPASRVPMKPRERRRPAGGEMTGTAGGRAVPVVKKRLKKVAAGPRHAPATRKPPYGWMAVAVVVMLVIAGYAGYSLLLPRTTLTARAFFPATAESGALVSFDGGNSTSTGKGVARYDWSFGDGSRATGRRASHSYVSPDTYTVTLRVQDQDGTRSAPYSSKITVSPLTVTVPVRRLNDRAGYSVNGTVDVRNTETFLYKVTVAGQQVAVSQVLLNLTGGMTQWVRDQLPEEDGFGANHSALWTTSSEDLDLKGKAFTNLDLQVTLSGELNYYEDSYADAATGGVFQVQSRARTSLGFYNPTGAQTSINSTDTLRSYPGVAGITSQFQPENIYRGKTFGQSGAGENGTYRSGNVTYFWSQMGVRNIGGMASLGLNVTAEKDYLDKNGLSEFFLNIWISGSCSLPTSTLVHVVGRSGDTSYSTEHVTTMTEFKAGSGQIDFGAQAFDKAPLPPELFASPFSDVPSAGAGNSSLRFSPEKALAEATARDGSFADLLSQNPQAYAVAAKYFEGQLGPGSATWNLTFSWPGAASSYWVNVTRDILQQYTVHGSFDTGPTQLKTAESALDRTLTMASAESRMRQNDPETASTFFKSGSISWSGGTSLELESDPVYPGINLASMYASGERAGYGVMLKKEGYTSAFAMDTGQMMYFYTHSNL